MSYTRLTTIENVSAYFKTSFTTTTNPSIATIEAWIDEATAIIYSTLAVTYVIPVTDADDLIILRNLANIYVRSEIMFANSRGTNTQINGRFTTPKAVNHSKFFDLLNKFTEGTLVLLGTSKTDNFDLSYSYTEANDIEFVADKDEDQW